MKEGFVTVNNCPTFVVTEGKWIDDKFNSELNENEVILLIPGNPGFAEFYTKFIGKLYKKIGIPIWVLSYAGHEIPPPELGMSGNFSPATESCKNSEQVKLFNLQEQIDHTVDFVRKYIPPDVKITVVGHSCGSWMTLELLKIPEIKKQIKKCYFLFPTIERLHDTSGFYLVKRFIIPYFAFFLLLAKIFNYVPYLIRLFLFRIAFIFLSLPSFMLRPALKIIDPKILPNIVHLANDEKIQISQVDVDLIIENKNLIKFLYGRTDPFVPKKFYYQLKEKIPDIDAELTHMDHGFMVKHDDELSDYLTKWIKSS